MRRRGFTIIELVIVIAVMAALLTLGVVNMRSSQANGRDTERKVDIETIAQHLETFYTSGTDNGTTVTDCTGGAITHDGLYTVHTFTTVGSSSLNCPGTISAEVLVVGGGGSGGNSDTGAYEGGGGGGGGYIFNSNFNLSSGVTVTVGTGGQGISGGNSVFSTLTAIGGGKGASGLNGTGSIGGSGGGGTYSAGLGGAGTSGQGYAGGSGAVPGQAGGGGGALQPGNTNGLHAGGDGLSSSISGITASYAGGGGGAPGGTGGTGGGAVAPSALLNNGSVGIANTGGGGSGAYSPDSTHLGGAGGSGIVIVRYLTPMGIGTYPSTLFLGTLNSIKLALRDIDTKSISAPGITDSTQTFIAATNNTQTTAGVLPQPTIDQYVYQPLHSDGTLCNDTAECRKFNLYYRQEVDSNVIMVTSLNQ